MIFQHRCVQDLAWVIQSPPVISGYYQNTRWLDKASCEAEYEACLPLLLQLDQDPEPLEKVLAQTKPYVIGKRFECFVHYWLTISPNFELLMHNYVLYAKNENSSNSKQTLGEADFFVRELATDKVIHLEVAVKFYLGVNTYDNDLSSMSHWYGTNLRDRLDIKFNRLMTHQTQLAYKYPELMPHPIDESWCLLKGRMFLPLKQRDQSSLSEFFAEECPKGSWLTTEQIPELRNSRNIEDKNNINEFLALDKENWLSEISNYSGELQSLPQMLNHSQCFARMHSDTGKTNTANEQDRFFLLPKDFFRSLNHDPYG